MAKNKVRLQRDFDPTVRVLRLVQFAEVKVFVYGWSRFIALYQLTLLRSGSEWTFDQA